MEQGDVLATSCGQGSSEVGGFILGWRDDGDPRISCECLTKPIHLIVATHEDRFKVGKTLLEKLSKKIFRPMRHGRGDHPTDLRHLVDVTAC